LRKKLNAGISVGRLQRYGQDEDAPKRTHRTQRHALVRSREGLRLALLLCVLAGVGTYALVTRVFDSSSSSSATISSACLEGRKPKVQNVSPQVLGALRESVARVLPERFGRLYEEGTVESANAWNDDSPVGPPVSVTQPRSGGYEMRWWAPGGDDIAADAFQFKSADEAQTFAARATSSYCRPTGQARGAPRPSGARNLTWINPDNAREVDIYVTRGTRVYRVVDVPSGQLHGRATTRALTHALITVDSLACLLPEANCARQQRPSVQA
jgi:hypothetical protein